MYTELKHHKETKKKKSQYLPYSGTQEPKITRNTHVAESFHPDTNIHM